MKKMVSLGRVVFTMVSILFVFQGCSRSSNSTLTNNGGSNLSCYASGNVVSGNTSTANSTVVFSNVSVSIYGGTGPYSVSLANGLSFTANSSAYTYSPGSNFSVMTGSSGGVSVSVHDTASALSGTCSIWNSGTTTGGTLTCSANGTVTSGSSSTPNSYVYFSNLNMSITGSSGPFTVTLLNGTSFPMASNSLVYTQSSYGYTGSNGGVLATVSDTSTGASGSCVISGSGSGGGTGSVSVTASPSTSVNVGSSISLVASSSGVASPYYQFSSNNASVAISAVTGNGYATLTSNVATSATITVQVYSNVGGALTLAGTNSVSVSFVGGTVTPTNLTCTLSHYYSVNYANQQTYFYIWTNTGEAVQLRYWYPGNNYSQGSAPYYPFPLNYGSSWGSSYGFFSVIYSSSGTYNVQVLAESVSRPGVYCNNGSYLTDTVTVY